MRLKIFLGTKVGSAHYFSFSQKKLETVSYHVQLNKLMEVLLSVEISINILAALVQVIALVMLVRTSKHSIKGSQKYLFISLSLAELSYGLISLIRFCCIEYGVKKALYQHLTIFRRIAVLLMYYLLMIYITLDRFFAIYLNVKYGIYWSPVKTKRLILFTAFFCIFASILVSVTWFQTEWSVTIFVYVYLYPPFMMIFIICAVVTYSYIVMKIIRREDTVVNQVTGNVDKGYHRIQRKTILVPSIIILTFIFFMVVPDFIHMVNYANISKLAKIIVDVNWILFPLGFISDAVVYIFSAGALRNMYIRKRKVANGN